MPRYVASAAGAYFTDIDGRRFLDLNNNYTTLIHGHAFAPVVEAVTRQMRDGACFANPTAAEIALAELIVARVPAIDSVRFVSTGTEAVMFAIKAARAFTGRHRIAKIEGSFHGASGWVSYYDPVTGLGLSVGISRMSGTGLPLDYTGYPYGSRYRATPDTLYPIWVQPPVEDTRDTPPLFMRGASKTGAEDARGTPLVDRDGRR